MAILFKKGLIKKSNLNDNNITIDAKHTEMIQNFKNQYKSIPNLKTELNKLVTEYNTKDNNRKNDIEYIIYRNKLKENIMDLKLKINSILNNEDVNKYYLDVGTLLHSYYDNIENSKCNDNSETFEKNLINYDEDEVADEVADEIVDEVEDEVADEVAKNKITTTYNILNFFNINESSKTESKIINSKITESKISDAKITDFKNENTYTSMKISDFVKTESKFKKTNILEEYLQKIDTKYISNIKIDTTIFKCKNCLIDMTIFASDGVQICEKCGVQENILIESDKPSFKDPPMEICYFSYRRINHYNEWLAQFQAKESTEIPDEVYEKILLEIKKERITNLEKIDTKKIRQFLKKNKLNKYYDHAAHILYQINGVQPPSMSKELEEKLRLMFKEIQGPFMEVCPKSRKNFLNYSYVLHKFVELLSLDEYKIYFPLLKDREKLHQTDMIWKKICDKLGWHFIKSI